MGLQVEPAAAFVAVARAVPRQTGFEDPGNEMQVDKELPALHHNRVCLEAVVVAFLKSQVSVMQ